MIINLHNQRTVSGEAPLNEDQVIQLRDYVENSIEIIEKTQVLLSQDVWNQKKLTNVENAVIDFKQFIQEAENANDQFEINIMKLKGFAENMKHLIEAYKNQPEDEDIGEEEEIDFVEDENTVLQN